MARSADYALGLEVDWREERVSGPDESRWGRVANDWPQICRSLGCYKKVGDDPHRAWIPPLLDHWRDGDIEYFDIAVPAVFVSADQTVNNQNPMAMLPTRLAAALGAKAAESIFLGSTDDLRPRGRTRCSELFDSVDVPVRRLALSFFVLPTSLKLRPELIPRSPVEFYLGQLSDGSDAIWNAAANPHACIAGATSSGKTTAVESLLLQNHWRGGRLVVATAKMGDRVIDQFADFPQHTVLAGLRGVTLQADLIRVRDALRDVRTEIERRQSIRAEHRCDAWHDVPVDVRGDASTVLVVIDESRSFMPISGTREPTEITDVRRQIAAEIDNAAQLARQEDVFIIILTQSPYADTLGSGFVVDQIHLWWSIRKLAAKWLATAYGQSESTNPKKLIDGTLPKGRAVVRGVTAPDNPFGQEAVRDGMMQVAYLDPDDPDDEVVRRALLNGDPVTFTPPDTPVDDETGIRFDPVTVAVTSGRGRGGHPVAIDQLVVAAFLPIVALLLVAALVVMGVVV